MIDRIRMAEGGIEMIKDYPVMGVGPAYIKEVYPLYRRADAPRTAWSIAPRAMVWTHVLVKPRSGSALTERPGSGARQSCSR